MINYYLKDFCFKSLVLVLVFAAGTLFSGRAYAQGAGKAIVVSTDNVVPSGKNILNACYGDEEFRVNILLGSVASTGSAFTITMPTGFEYAGNATLDGNSIVEESTSTSTKVTFLLDLPAAGSSNSIELSFRGRANCQSIVAAGDPSNLPRVEYSLQHFLFDDEGNPVLDEDGNPVPEGAPSIADSEGLNILFAILNITVSPTPIQMGVIGEVANRTLTITNTGTGALDQFTIVIAHGSSLVVAADPVAPTGWDVTPLPIGDPDGKTFLISTSGAPLANGESVNITEAVQVINCEAEQLGTNYEVYYGCDDKCTAAGVNANARATVNYVQAGTPTIGFVKREISPNPIVCLDQEVEYSIVYRNTGTLALTEGIVNAHVSTGNTNYSIGGAANGLLGHLVSGNVEYRKASSEDELSAAVFVSVAPENLNLFSSTSGGFTDQPSRIGIPFGTLEPEEYVEVRFKVKFTSVDPAVNCEILPELTIPAVNTQVSGINAAACPPTGRTTFGGFTNHRAVQNFTASASPYGDNDVLVGEYKLDVLLSAITGGSQTDGPFSDDSYYDIVITLPDEFAPVGLDNGNIFLSNNGTNYYFDNISGPVDDGFGNNVYRLRIERGGVSGLWPANGHLNIPNTTRLTFNTIYTCSTTAPYEAWYKVSGELGFNHTCPPLVLSCTTVTLNAQVCVGAGDCSITGGAERLGAALQRVDFGYPDFNNDGIPDPGFDKMTLEEVLAGINSPTDNTDPEYVENQEYYKGINIRAFVGMEEVELLYRAYVWNGNATPAGGWTDGWVKFDTPSELQLEATRGIVTVIRGGTSYQIPLPSSGNITKTGDTFTFNFSATDPAFAVIGNKFEDGDELIGSIFVRTTSHMLPGAQSPKHYVFTGDIALVADGQPYQCGFHYTATGIYNNIRHIVNNSSAANITIPCGTQVGTWNFGLQLNGAWGDGVFVNEFRQFTTLDKVTIQVPEGLELIGVNFRGTLEPGVVSEIGNNSSLAPYHIDLSAAPVQAGDTYVISDLASEIAKIRHDAGHPNDARIEGGYFLRILPIFGIVCTDPTVNSGTVSIAGGYKEGPYTTVLDGSNTFMTNPTNFTVNYRNSNLNLTLSDKEGRISGNRIIWQGTLTTGSIRHFNNVWVGLKNLPVGATVVAIEEINSLTQTSPGTDVMNPTTRIGEFGYISAGTTRYYRYVIELDENCAVHELDLVWGSGCDSYPTDVSTVNACQLGTITGLTYPEFDPQIQTTLMVDAGDGNKRPDICEDLEYIVRFSNPGNANATNLRFTAALQTGALEFIPGSFRIVDGSYSTITTIDDALGLVTPSGLGFEFSLPDDVQLVPGQPLYVAFKVRPDACNFRSGEFLRIQPTADNVCGDPIPSGAKLQTVTSARIRINGVPATEPNLKIVSDINNFVFVPEGSPIAAQSAVIADYTFTLTNEQPTVPAEPDYNFKITLPEGWSLSDIVYSSNPVGLPAGQVPTPVNGVYTFDGWANALQPGQSISFTAKLLLSKDAAESFVCESDVMIHEQSGFSVDISDCSTECPTIDHIVVENTVSATVPPVPAPTAEAIQEFCYESTTESRPTLADVVINGTRYAKWYSSPTGDPASELPITTEIPGNVFGTRPYPNGTTFYVRNFLVEGAACASELVPIQLRANPKLEIIDPVETFCVSGGGFRITFRVVGDVAFEPGSAPYLLSNLPASALADSTWVRQDRPDLDVAEFVFTSGVIEEGTNFTFFLEGNTDCEAPFEFNVTAPICYIELSGQVINDINGHTDGILNGDGTNAGNTLFANLIDSDGNVVHSVPVSADGIYKFVDVPVLATYHIHITINEGVTGEPAPAIQLPEGWVNTGDYPDNTLETDPDPKNNQNGSIAVVVDVDDIDDMNFGIEQRPTAVGDSSDPQINPGGENTVSVPGDLFGGTDPDDGIITAIIITEFPTNVDKIIIDGVEYTNLTEIETAYPDGIVTNELGVPLVDIEIDPIDGDPAVDGGDITVEIPFLVVDNAGVPSLEPSVAEMPFIGRRPAIGVVKTATGLDPDPTVFPEDGDEITYTFVVTNEGNVPLYNVILEDVDFDGHGTKPMVPVFQSASDGSLEGTLLVGESATYELIYELIQADVDQGELNNEVLATGEDLIPGLDPIPVTDEDIEHVDLPHNPLVEITKAGVYTGDPERAEVGDLIEYTFVVTNTGNVTLSNVTIDEDTLFEGFGVKPDLSAPVASDGTSTEAALAPYATLTYTASYALTQEDIDKGEVVNQAVVSGTPPGNPQDPNPDPIEDHSDDPNDPTDVDPDGDGNPDDPTIIPLPQDPLVELTKSSVYTGNPDRAEVGDIIEYTFVVTNTGNVTLHDVTVDETLFTGSGTHPVLSAPVANPSSSTAAALAPYATLTYTATYAITQDDINAGEVVNQAIVRGTPPGNPQDPNPDPIEDHSDDPNDPTDVDPDGDGNPDDPTVTPLPQMPLIDLQKSAVNHGDANNAQVGDRIDYTFVLTNTGNVTLRDVGVQDDVLFSGTGTKPVLSAPVGNPYYSSESVLHPGATLTYTASYEITQDDINAGQVTNQALASGTPPGNPQDPNPDPIEDHSDDPNDPTDVDPDGDGNPDDPTVVDLGQNPGLELLKDGVFDDNNGDGVAQPGETITYTFTVNNTGNVKLTDLVIDDARIGVAGLAVNPSTLNPGEQGEATFSYAITQSDIDEGGVWNIATVTGKDPKGGDVTDDSEDPTPLDPNDDSYDPECPDCTVTPLPQGPNFTITKTADKARISEAGEVITYTIIVRNTGNTTLQNMVVTDVLFPNWSETIQSLAPGASERFELKYTVTQEDIDSGSVLNVAKVTAEDPDGDPLDPKEDEEEVPVTQTPNFDITKTADKTTISAPGEVITYTITVRNTGNTTLQNVVVTDILFPDWSETIQTMLPGASQSFELKYTVTQEDIDAGSVLNVAKATAEDPEGKPLDPKEGEEEVPVANMPALEVTKTADKATVSASGDVITYTITVRNTGNVTLSNVRVVDPLTGMNETIARLGVDESRTFTTMYTVKGEDLRNGLVRNVVKATGEDPTGKPVEDEDTVDVPVENCVFRIPNIFTPNGDGINDLFVIEGIECLDRVEVLIFNRWGNEVYRNDNYRNDWAGLNLNDGVYYYLINTHESGNRTVHRGWVVLKRD